MKPVAILAVLVVEISLCAGAFGQTYPTKPVRMVVPFSAGSATDVVARMVSQKLAESWGMSVIVDNRVGAGGTVGAGVVAKSTAEGYTLLLHSTGLATSAALYNKLPYDTFRDFVAIGALVSQPYVLVVGPAAGLKSVNALIAAAKAKPGQINFASAGLGSGTHLAAEKFKLAAGIDVIHIPYKGGPEAHTDTMTGRVTYWFPPISIVPQFVSEKKLLALGVSSARRSSLLPEVPTIAEAGVPGFVDTIWWGIWAPAGTPSQLVDRIATDVARALSSQDLRDRFTTLGAEPMSMTPAEFARFVRSEADSVARIVKAAGIKPQ